MQALQRLYKEVQVRKAVIGGLIAVLVVLFALALAGCGGKKEDADKDKESGRGTVTCSGTATTDPTGLPSDFPQISGVTLTKATADGPSKVVNGYGNQDLDGLFSAYESGFKSAGYTITDDEKEEDDAEIDYQTGDKSTEGQVALRSCDPDTTTSVQITNRPS